MMRIVKWLAVGVALVAAAGFLAFLYFIPPFFSIPPEDYAKQAAAPAASLDDISDPGERAIAARGRYIVMITGCADCHSAPGPEGPDPSMYLAGGMKLGARGGGTAVSRNLTPDPETGLGTVKDEDVKRVLRSGVFRNGRPVHARHMPWPVFANWSEEDLHAVVTYLRHTKAIRHQIPDPHPAETFDDPNAAELFFNKNFGSGKPAAP